MCCKQCKVQSVILQEWPLLLTSTMRHSPTAAAFLLHSAASVVVISSAILFVADINNCVWQSKRGVSNPLLDYFEVLYEIFFVLLFSCTIWWIFFFFFSFFGMINLALTFNLLALSVSYRAFWLKWKCFLMTNINEWVKE